MPAGSQELLARPRVCTRMHRLTLALALASCAAPEPERPAHPSEVPGSTPPVVSRSRVVQTITIERPAAETPISTATTDSPTVEQPMTDARPTAPTPLLSAAVLAPVVAGADAALFAELVRASNAGDDALGKQAMLKLVRDHPNSRLVPFAFVHLGDRFFARGDLDSARSTYRKAIQFTDADAVAYAHFRLGWCDLLRQPADPTGALEAFSNAILTASTATTPHGVHARTVRRAARIDLVTAYVEIGKPDKAGAFFDRLGKGPGGEDDRADMLRALAAAYFGAGRSAEALLVCRALLDRDLAAGRSCP